MAREEPNREPAIEPTQELLDDGYLTAWRYDDHGNLRQIANPHLRKLHREETILQLTDQGEAEGYAFYEFIRSAEGRAGSVRFAKQYVADKAKQLRFRAILPEDLPLNFDPLPDAIVYPDDDTVTLRYYEELDDQLFIDETTQELGEDEVEFDKETATQERIGGVEVHRRERQLTDAWAELSMTWQIGPVFYRLSYHRTVASEEQATEVALDEEDANDNEAAEREFQSPEVDPEMREASQRLVASMIRQV